jgi:hypothetical protein
MFFKKLIPVYFEKHTKPIHKMHSYCLLKQLVRTVTIRLKQIKTKVRGTFTLLSPYYRYSMDKRLCEFQRLPWGCESRETAVKTPTAYTEGNYLKYN